MPAGSGGDSVPATEIKIRTENKYHKVKSGESLGLIAGKYNVQVAKLKSWNKIKGNTIHPGQKLVVGKTEIREQVAVKSETEPKTSSKKSSSGIDFKYYTVRQGDTLWKIAQKHEGVTVEQIMKLNNINNERSLKPGQKIKVGYVS